MNTFTLVITEEHFNRAIEALKASSADWNKKCILAQAAKDIFPEFISCGYTSITVRTKDNKNAHYITEDTYSANYSNHPLFRLVKDFDKASVFTYRMYKLEESNIEAIRTQLPMKVEFKLDYYA